MKKIIAIVVAIACLVALVSCGANDVDKVGAMFEASRPTKTVVATTQQFGDTILESEYTLITGLIGDLKASVYEATYDELISVEEGSGETIYDSVVEKYECLEYLEGYGVRKTEGVTVGKWDAEAENFASANGPMSLNLSSEYIKTFTYEAGKLRCVVAAKNTAEVLGIAEDLAVDVSIELTDDGASITSVIITYTIPADEEAEVPETIITIKAFYFYDLQKIEINVK